jgi:hypothetical protein
MSIKEKYQDTESYPGEVCTSEIPCRYGNCIENRCEGKLSGQACTGHYECDPGLRCHHTCKALFKPGDRGCLSDPDCTSDSGCNYGECTLYLSLRPGYKVEKCEDFNNILCQSSMCDRGKCISYQYSDVYPKECSSNYDCFITLYYTLYPII